MKDAVTTSDPPIVLGIKIPGNTSEHDPARHNSLRYMVWEDSVNYWVSTSPAANRRVFVDVHFGIGVICINESMIVFCTRDDKIVEAHERPRGGIWQPFFGLGRKLDNAWERVEMVFMPVKNESKLKFDVSQLKKREDELVFSCPICFEVGTLCHCSWSYVVLSSDSVYLSSEGS